MRNRWFLLIGLLGTIFFAGAQPAHAVCTNPDGAAADVVFNKDYKVLQYCDDTNWRQIGAQPTGSNDCPNIGDTCTDGSIYAGLSPDGGVAMYTTPADAASTYTWNDGTTNYTDMAMVNCTDSSPGISVTCQTGEANTAFLVGATGEPDYPFAAAEYCDGLSAHGQSDWYLPAQDELNVLYTNKNTGALNGTFNETGSYPAGHYRSSSERDTNATRSQRFSDGNQNGHLKNVGFSVRCVRRQTATIQQTSFIPDGLVGHWKLDETSGTSVTDSSTNSNDGFMLGSGDAGNDSVTGRVLSAFDFNGVDQGALFGNPGQLANVFDGGGSIAFWAWVDSGASNYVLIDKAFAGTNGYLLMDSGGSLVFEKYFSGTAGAWELDVETPINKWLHVVVTYDNDSVVNNPLIYIDGALQAITETSTPSGTRSDDTNDDFVVANIVDESRGLDGKIDDVRIYDRELTEEEISYLYSSFDGNIKYDKDVRTPKYFNGDDWVAMGPSKYIPNAVAFDGTNDYLSYASPLAGVSDGKTITASFWAKFNSYPSSACFDVYNTNPSRVRITYCGNGTETMQINLRDTSGAIRADVGCGPDPHVVDTWYHHLISVDMATGTAHCYVDDVDSIQTFAAPTDTTLDFTNAQHFIGAGAGPTAIMNGSVADLWIDYETYIDFSIEANRRKFIDADGNPIYLGANGTLPTGSAPDIFLSGDTDTWHTNKGTGGGFTENGALTEAITKPGQVAEPSCDTIGETCADGLIYAGLSPDGSEPMYTTPADAPSVYAWNDGTSNYTDIAMVNCTDTSPGTASSCQTGEANTALLVALNGSGTPAPYAAAEYCNGLSAHGYDDWYLPAQDELNVLHTNKNTGDLNGTFDETGTLASFYWSSSELDNQNARLQRFTDGLQFGTNKNTGITVRCVRKQATHVINNPVCANPTRVEGSMIYNSDANVMQYCDGEEWQAVGP
jgi:hypothetical protein